MAGARGAERVGRRLVGTYLWVHFWEDYEWFTPLGRILCVACLASQHPETRSDLKTRGFPGCFHVARFVA